MRWAVVTAIKLERSQDGRYFTGNIPRGKIKQKLCEKIPQSQIGIEVK
jgi:hypothetical protein